MRRPCKCSQCADFKSNDAASLDHHLQQEDTGQEFKREFAIQSTQKMQRQELNTSKKSSAIGELQLPDLEKEGSCSPETAEEHEKEVRLRQLKVLRKKKWEATMKERARIKAQIASDRLELQSPRQRESETPMDRRIVGTATCAPFGGGRDKKPLNSSEKSDPLKEATILRKKKRKAFARERARIKAEIERDRQEYQLRQGGSSPKLKTDTSASTIEPKRATGALGANEKVATAHRISGDSCRGRMAQIDLYVKKICSHTERQEGGTCLKILLKYITNIIHHPTEEKYRKINVNNKIYKTKVQPIVGAKLLLLEVGFVLERQTHCLILADDADMDILEQSKDKLERARFSHY